MELYSIYSSGGGGGDWNGVNRIFSQLPFRAKNYTLLKYGDVFLNHAASTRGNIIRAHRYDAITNLRDWLFERTHDEEVYDINILLDTGAAKITSWIQANLEEVNSDTLLTEFEKVVDENNLIEHYAQIIANSKVDKAVSFDIPNPFKMRAVSVVRRLNVVEHSANIEEYIDLCAKYTNLLYNHLVELEDELFAKNVLMATIDASWSLDEINGYISRLTFIPENFAFGGLIGMKQIDFIECAQKLMFWLESFNTPIDQIHFLGCGGLNKTRILKQIGFDEGCSVDVSTPINRAIDGSINGNETGTVSKYYSYNTGNLIKIDPSNEELILNDHSMAHHKLFSDEEMVYIIEQIIRHQNRDSDSETYDARAKLIFHNYDVYRSFCNE
ncbi:hypothetical protein [Robertmurraya sp. Marseille-Q9965]